MSSCQCFGTASRLKPTRWRRGESSTGCHRVELSRMLMPSHHRRFTESAPQPHALDKASSSISGGAVIWRPLGKCEDTPRRLFRLRRLCWRRLLGLPLIALCTLRGLRALPFAQ